jgi:phosphatidylglycerol lysyltransferase
MSVEKSMNVTPSKKETSLRGRKKLLRSALPLFSVALFVLALYVLYHELKNYHYRAVVHYFQELPPLRLLIAIFCSMMSYLMLTGYDYLGLRYAMHPLKYQQIAFASYTGYAFSNNIGFSFLSGGFIRYRLYSAWGLSAVEVTKVVALNMLTALLGYFTVSGVAFTVEGEAVPSLLHLPVRTVRPLGIIFLCVILVYFIIISVVKKPLKIKSFEYPLPSIKLSIAQIAISSMDWLFAGSALYFLLPEGTGVSLPGFFGIYLLAQLAGMVSQVPGGIGVFEMVMVLLLPSSITHSQIIGALLTFRILYYFLPLAVAALLLGGNEFLQKKEGVLRIAKRVSRGLIVVAPNAYAYGAFAAGALLLLSGSLPSVQGRLHWLAQLVPLHVIEGSHFLSSIVGIVILLTARGLQQRLNAAYYLIITLIVAGVLLSFFRGFRYEEGIILTVLGAALLPARKEFYRKATLIEERFSPGWIIAILLVLISSLWLGFFSNRHVRYTQELWWQFSLSGNAPRVLRTTVGVFVVILFFALGRLLRPARLKPRLPTREELKKAYSVVKKSSSTNPSIALLGNKAFLFSASGESFLMYAVKARNWVVFGDPVGPEEEWEELFWQFRGLCDRYGGRTVFYDVAEQHLPFYQSMGLSILKFGEQGRVPLAECTLEGCEFKSIRHTHNLLLKEGFSFQILSPEEVADLIHTFKRIPDDWLSSKRTKEMVFSLSCLHTDYLLWFPMAVVRKGEVVYAFAKVLSGAKKEEISVDFIQFSHQAPAGIMDYLYVELMLWGKSQGYRWFNLGIAPLAGFEGGAFAPLWERTSTFIFPLGEYSNNFQTIRKYKEKFNPEWESRYIVAPGGLVFPKILLDVAMLVSGGLTGIAAK